MRHATVRQLEVFTEAARTLSYARSAERLNLTPAAVSFQVRQLEATTGFALFERVGKKARLTAAGEVLLSYAKVALQALHDADQSLTALKGLDGGRVTVGLVSTAKYLVPHMLARFQESVPGAAIRLIDGNRPQILDALIKGDVDLAIMGQPPDGIEVEGEPFAPHPSVIVGPHGHAFAAAGEMPRSALAFERFVVREEGSGTRALMDRYFQDAGFTPRIAMVSSSNETIKQAVMAGMGLAFLSRHTIELELGVGLLAVIPVEGLPLMRAWHVVHRRGLPLLPVHARLRDFLAERGQAIIGELGAAYSEIGGRGPDRRLSAARASARQSASERAGTREAELIYRGETPI